MDGDRDRVRRRIYQQLDNLTVEQLVAVETFLSTQLSRADEDKSLRVRDWPHAPLHRVSEKGTYLVTAGTLNKEHLFRGEQRLDLLEQTLLAFAKQYGWQLEAWVVFSNHYHFVGQRTLESAELKTFLGHLHGDTARDVNELDQMIGRQVWYNFWDTQLTYEKSYLTRLNYVHQNAVKHGLVKVANQYPWCSAAWFERTAAPAQVKTIYGFKTDKLNVFDEFEPE